MKGMAQMIDSEVITMTPEAATQPKTMTLQTSVRQSLQQYFAQLDGQLPAELYSLVLAEVEKPLLEMVLKLTNNNQSKAAKILAISRGTLRKKMAIYGLN